MRKFLNIRHSFLLVFLLLSSLLINCKNENAGNEKAVKKSTQPNIIFIMTDDMGYETVGYNDAINYKTPNIDKLAQEAFVFTNCDAQPLCCPTRIKLMSGQDNYRNYKGWGSFNLEFPAIGKIMQNAGYATAVFGKWHMNKSPEELGFDEHCYFDGSPPPLPYDEFFKRYFYNCPLIEDGERIVVPYSPDKFNQRVLKFIDEHREKPFFIYYPLSLAHNPFEPTPDSDDPTSTNWQKNFEDMVAYADKMIGNVVKKLKEDGLYENTIIFYTADNGTKTLAHHMKNGDVIYGGKGTQVVDGCHVPLFIKYDGTYKTLDDLVDFADFYPTLASIAGVKKDELSNRLDGVSLHPLLKREVREEKPFIFSTYFHPLSAYIRNKQYKYHFDGRLYDIIDDPRELRPFYARNDNKQTAEARIQLKEQLADLLEDEEMSQYATKNKLINKFGDYQDVKENNWMLGGYIFDELEYTPTLEIISCDITKFLSEDEAAYSLRIERRKKYADAVIKSVKLFKNGKTIYAESYDDIELTTRVNTDVLRKKGNPIIAFTNEGDGIKLSLGQLSVSGLEQVKLQVETELSNPGNQWGDRIILNIYLDKNE